MRGIAAILALCLPLFAADDAEVRRLIAQLGAEDPSVREEASSRLAKLADDDTGGPVEGFLREAARSEDAEVRSRAKAILDGLRQWERVVLFGGEAAGAVDASNGEYLWRRDRPREMVMGPRQRGAAVYLHASGGEQLECVDLVTGATRWKAEGARFGRLVEGGDWLAWDNQSITRISLADGAQVWRVDAPPSAFSEEGGPVQADLDGVYWPTTDGTVSFDAANGRERWRSPSGCLAAARGGVYAFHLEEQAPGRVVRLDPASGKEVWSHEGPVANFEPSWSDAGKASGLLLFADVYDNSVTIALHAETGKEAWRLGGDVEIRWVTPDGAEAWATCEDEDVHGKDRSRLIVIDLASGAVRADFPRDEERKEIAIQYEGGALFVLEYGEDSCVVALREFDWKARSVRWSTPLQTNSDAEQDDSCKRAWLETLGGRLFLAVEGGQGNYLLRLDPDSHQVLERLQPR